jgi:hypothetical protein
MGSLPWATVMLGRAGCCFLDDCDCLLDDCDVRDEDNPLLAGGNGLIGGKL